MMGPMLLRSLAIVLAVIPSSLSLNVRRSEVNPVLPGAYIVEFEESATARSADPQAAFYAELAENSIAATPRVKLNYALFRGASFRLDSTTNHEEIAAQIETLGMVKKIWPVRLYKKPRVETEELLNVADVHNLQKRQSLLVDTYEVHKMGGVDLLRAEGYTGKGLFVAIVDTGVDYNHPALGGGFGPGFKIAHGYDLVGDAYDGTNTPVPDPDPFASCEGHGTHVAGIIGANQNPLNFTGIVPDATLGMYRVFGCFNNAGNDVLINAFMMAFNDGADIITASIGGASGWSEDAWSVAVQRIVEAGTPCSLSAGNDGASGVFNASTAAGGIGVLSVGSVDSVTSPSNLTVGNFSINGGAVQKFVYDLGGGAFPSETFPLYAINFDTTDAAQACSPLPAGTPDLTNFVVLIRRGGCTFETKANNAHAFGARYILFYNNQPSGILAPSIGAAAGILGEAMVFASQGVSWIQTLQSGSPISITVSTPSESKWIYSNDVNLVTGGYMSTYSTWSPTFEMYITPVVSAPGGNILSTYPLANGGYAVLSGTSMACPYVAGIVAIIKQARGRTLAPGVINALIASTATPIGFNAGTATRYPFLAPVIQQGGGLIDAYQAVHSQTIIRPPYISFNDTRHFLDHADISIFNVGKEAVTYTFSYIAAGTAYTLAAVGDQIPDTFTPEMVTTSATIKFDKRALSVKPNEIGTVKVQLNLPVGLTEARLPVYSGYIAINASNGDYFTVPYAGLDADLSKAAVMNTVDGFPWLTTSNDALSTPITAGQVFNVSSGVLPTIVAGLALGTAYVDIDLVPYPSSSSASVGLGSIVGWPQTYLAGNEVLLGYFDGNLQSGEVAPAGTYTFLIRLLKIMGDPTHADDYEMFSTPSFILAY